MYRSARMGSSGHGSGVSASAWRGVVAAGLVVTALGISSRADAADPAYFKLDFLVEESLDGCPDEAGLRANVAARLGYDPFDPKALDPKAHRTLVTRMRKVGAGARSHIELRDEAGKLRGVRDLDASTCADLTASTAFAIAVAIDPERANAAPDPRPPAPPVPGPAPPPDPPPSPAKPPPPAPPASASPPAPIARTPWVPTIFLGVFGAGLGPYAGFTGGGAAGIMVEHGALSFGVEGRASIPSRTAAGSGQVRTQLVGASPVVCARITEASLCAQAFFGAFQGAAEDVTAPEKATTFFSSLGLRAGYRFYPARPSGFGLEPYAGADVVLTRTRVNFRGQEVWSTSPLALELGIRAAYSFF